MDAILSVWDRSRSIIGFVSDLLARWRSATDEQLRPPVGVLSGGRMLACRKWGYWQTGCYYLNIPSRSCYCAPMICVFVPEARIFSRSKINPGVTRI